MLRIYNSLTKKVEEFQPLNAPKVGMYTCGPTVYDYVHIGNFRTYTTADLLLRVLGYNTYNVTYIMNITDVGHLTGDNLGDADTGEDRMEKASRKEGKSAWDVAKYYEEIFKEDFGKFNLTPPKLWTRATEYIKEQITLVETLENKGFTYKTTDGIYFDTSKFPDYGKLSPLDHRGIIEGARIGKNPEKRNPTDFALWKFSPSTRVSTELGRMSSGLSRRQMEWESPWGLGFPGWHIECSAMSMKYLGETFDIHAGGEDLAATHHPNEIAQSEAATGKPFVRYWVHGAFMMVNGERMSKSLGNNFRLTDVVQKGFYPADLRYLYLQTHYRQKMNFTWEALQSTHNSLAKLKEQMAGFKSQESDRRTVLSEEKLAKVQNFSARFRQMINNDLNMPQALAVLWEVAKSSIPSEDKYDLLIDFDTILGLGLKEVVPASSDSTIPQNLEKLLAQREQKRKEKKWEEADIVRQKIAEAGYLVKDTPQGPRLIKKELTQP